MNRGYQGMKIFREQSDFEFFLHCVEEVFKSHTLVIHAYCLMDNHFHLLTETPHANLSKAMHRLESKYASYFKAKYQHQGKVFWKRYKAILVDNSTYGIDLVRYIHRNPLGVITQDLEDFTHSSYRAYLGMTPVPSFLDLNLILNRFDIDRQLAIKKLKEHTFLEGASYWLPDEFIAGRTIMGSESFIERVKEFLPEAINKELSGLVALKKDEKVSMIKNYVANLSLLVKQQKQILLYALRKKTQLSSKEICFILGESLSSSAMSNRVQRLKERARVDLKLAKILIEIDSCL
ncbi:MAG: transposase [Candidatus Melainabacteria bacterium]|nr:transposase [Candidatus Melainabacteria bacterium]